MKIIVSNKLLITNPTDAVKRWCATKLQVRNPEYVRRKRMGLWLGRTPEFLCLYEEVAPNLI